jgi:protein-tyrosine phosphatase
VSQASERAFLRQEEPFRVLVVCAGNICRSPAGELLLQPRLAPFGILVASAGVIAPEGEGVHPWTAAALADLGVDASPHRARRLAPEHLARSDLVLAASRELRADAVRLQPSVVSRTWTLREFLRYAEAAYPSVAGVTAPGTARLVALRDTATTLRGTLPRVAAEEDDIGDPITGGEADHRATVIQVAGLTDRLAALITS